MPEYLFKTYNTEVSVLVWEITESREELLSQLPESILEDNVFLAIQVPHLQVEFLVGRLITSLICRYLNIDYQGITKDEHGKPHLINVPWEMTLSHAKSFVVVAVHPTKPIGVDIEKPSQKLKRIMPRLFSPSENAMVGSDLKKMSWFWSAKEALYKLYGKRGIDFREHLQLDFTKDKFLGKINLPSHQSEHELIIEEIANYYLIIAV